MRYFFHLIEGDGRVVDSDGQEFPGDREARRSAVMAAADALRDRGRHGGEDFTHLEVQVTDEAGRTVMDLTVEDAVTA